MKKIIIVLVLLLVSVGVTYAYIVENVRTNDAIVKIGTPDVKGASLTQINPSTDVLVPINVITSSTNEVKQIQFELYVEHVESKNYLLDTNFPKEFRLTTNRTESFYRTNTTYILTLELLEEVDYTEYSFFLYINFM